MKRRARAGHLFAWAATALALALVLVALPGAPQDGNSIDPRNREKGEARKQPDCLGCHRVEGMMDTHIVRAQVPRSLKLGEPADVALRVDNTWIHEITQLQVTLTFPGPENGLRPVGAAALDDADDIGGLAGELGSVPSQSLPDAPPPTATLDLPVRANARLLVGHLDLHPIDPMGDVAPQGVQVQAFLEAPNHHRPGAWTPNDAATLSRDVIVERGDLVQGTWHLALNYTNGMPLRVAYRFNATIYYGNPEGATVELPPWQVYIPPRAHATLPLRIQGVERGSHALDIQVRATIFHDHVSAGYDWDNYSRYRTVDVTVGDVYEPPDELQDLGLVAQTDSARPVAEILGISSAALLPPALLLGGTFGRGSRQMFNAVLGGAKRRVMFHSLVSMGLSLVALAHVILFFMEARYNVAVGLLWGGLGLIALLLLALTGYYQVPLIQRYGFSSWRRLHLALGILVILFTAAHAVLDGADFGVLRERLPEWVTRWNLVNP